MDIRTLEGCVNRKACVLETFDALEQGESVEVELGASAEGPLQGIQVEVAGRASRLEPFVVEPAGTGSKVTLSIDGPWPAEVRLRAVARSGVLSAPWRVDVEPAR